MYLVDDCVWMHGLERLFSGDHLPHEHSKGVSITLDGRLLTAQELWCLVTRRAHEDSFLDEAACNLSGAAKVAQLGASVGSHKHVARLHVQMEDALLVDVSERLGYVDEASGIRYPCGVTATSA